MNIFVKFCTVIVVSICALLIHGFVASKLYMWFILPIFALPNISWLAFSGIVLFVQLFNSSSSPDKTSLEDTIIMHIAIAITNLSIGYGLHYVIYGI